MVSAAAHAVAFTVASSEHDTTPMPVLTCRARGAIASLRGTGYAGPVVCLAFGKPELYSALRPSCTVVRIPYLPRFDAGSDPLANTSETIKDWRRHQRVPPPDYSRVQRRGIAIIDCQSNAEPLAIAKR